MWELLHKKVAFLEGERKDLSKLCALDGISWKRDMLSGEDTTILRKTERTIIRVIFGVK